MSETKPAASTRLTMFMCFLVTVLEGYDLQIISSAGPILQRQMGLTPDQTGLFFSATLIGLAIGAIIGGRLADRIGRKPALIWSVAVLGLFTLLTTVAPNFEAIIALRILAGVGLGGAMPTLIALVAEIAGGKDTTSAVTTIIVGQPLGGIISALTGRMVTEAYGWQALFLIGGVLTMLTVPLLFKLLPETGAPAQHSSTKMPMLETLLGGGRGVPTVLLWGIFILTLALLSILLSWTPILVMGKGFARETGLSAIMAINAGGIIGGLVMSRLIDRMGVRIPMVALYVVMTVALYLFASAADVSPIMATAFLVGFAVLGAQFTLYGVAPQLYPRAGRGVGVGVAVAMGRIGSILGPVAVGSLLTAGHGANEVLAVMAPVALASGLAVLAMTVSWRQNISMMTGAEAAVRSLQLHGVRHIFGLCGDTSLPFYDALARLDHGMQHILTRDERHAAYMADAYARVTGRPGVCEGPSGGGATYIIPGVIEANESAIPLLAITSDVPVTARGRYPLTELDQKTLFAPLTKWNGVADHVSHIPAMFRKAFRAITTGRPGAAHIGLPYDLQKQVLDEDEVWAQAEHAQYPAFRTGPDPDMVGAAAEAILSARAPVFVVGGGVILSDACGELRELAEWLGAPVASTVSGHGAIADDHPLALGVVGTNGGTDETRAVLVAADLVVFVGARAGSTTTEHRAVPGRDTRIVHIDVDPEAVGANYRYEAALVGDAKLCLAALILAVRERLSEARGNGELAAKVATSVAAKRAKFDLLARSDDRPIRPERVLKALQDNLPDDAILVADPGTPCPYFSGHYRFNSPGRRFITNRAQGALGFALSAALGAQIGQPDAKVVAAMGDGSFAFTVGEMETLVRMNLPITLVVFSNSAFGWIKASQKSGYDARYFSVDFTRTDHAAIARAYGLAAWTVEDPLQVEAVIARAVRHDGPSLVDVICQPLENTAVPVSQWMG